MIGKGKITVTPTVAGTALSGQFLIGAHEQVACGMPFGGSFCLFLGEAVVYIPDDRFSQFAETVAQAARCTRKAQKEKGRKKP